MGGGEGVPRGLQTYFQTSNHGRGPPRSMNLKIRVPVFPSSYYFAADAKRLGDLTVALPHQQQLKRNTLNAPQICCSLLQLLHRVHLLDRVRHLLPHSLFTATVPMRSRDEWLVRSRAIFKLSGKVGAGDEGSPRALNLLIWRIGQTGNVGGGAPLARCDGRGAGVRAFPAACSPIFSPVIMAGGHHGS
jgi:hypothetical protein